MIPVHSAPPDPSAPLADYRARLAARRAGLAAVDRRDALISHARLVVFLSTLVACYFAFSREAFPWPWVLAFILPFIALVWAHSRVDRDRSSRN